MYKIGIIGAGAVGTYFIWGTKGCDHVEVSVIADDSRVEKLKKGISVNNELFTPVVRTVNDSVKYDLILVATKYSGLNDAIDMLKAISTEDTIILSLLNGVNSEELIREAGVKGHILYSVMRIASRKIDDSYIFAPERTEGVFFGATCEEEEKYVAKIADIFKGTRVNFVIHEDIVTNMWFKYVSNIANNLPQAVLGTDASLYVDSEHGHFIASKLWHEAWLVAKSRGITLPEEVFIFTAAPKTAKYSTLQDIEAGRHTEVDMFAGHLISMAKEAGIDVPFMEYTYHAIKALEEKNDGVIGRLV